MTVGAGGRFRVWGLVFKTLSQVSDGYQAPRVYISTRVRETPTEVTIDFQL